MEERNARDSENVKSGTICFMVILHVYSAVKLEWIKWLIAIAPDGFSGGIICLLSVLNPVNASITSMTRSKDRRICLHSSCY